MKREKTCMKIIIAIAVILSIHMVVTTERGEKRQQEEEEKQEQENAASIDDVCAGVTAVFNGEGNVAAVRKEEIEEESAIGEDGFVYYEIPEKYKRAGGDLPEDVQRYAYSICKQEGVDYALILAMIEHESGYRCDSVGDNGESIGYMQIMKKWHEERMERAGATDLSNPYQNICIGVDYMKELLDRYGTTQDALAVYNYGEAGAREKLWSKGIHVFSYNESIMNRAKEIEEVIGE